MVAPVVGPATTILSDVRSGVYYWYDRKVKYKQKPPFTLNLPYIRQVGKVTFANIVSNPSISYDADALPPNVVVNATWIRLNNLSYDRVRTAAYATASLGVNLVEYNQAVRMISSTALTLTSFSKELKRGNFKGAARALRMKYVPPGVSKAKSFGNNFLEYHFGWRPLVNDIYDAVGVINDPKMWFGVTRANAREPLKFSENADFGSTVRKSNGSGFINVQQGVRIRGVRSGPLFTLEQLGINNPASLIWEVIPYSFVVDWFVNVGDYLRSFSDFSGLVIDSAYTVSFYRFQVKSRSVVKATNALTQEYVTNYVYTERTNSLTSTQLQVKRLKPPSATRATTAISLLLQKLR